MKTHINQNTSFMKNKMKRSEAIIEAKNEQKTNTTTTTTTGGSTNTTSTTTGKSTTVTSPNANSNNNIITKPKIKKPRHIPRTGSANNTTKSSTTPQQQPSIPLSKRINLKSVVTKTKVLVARGQKKGKGQKAKATKGISGSVKKAIKAAKMNNNNHKK